MQFQRISSGTPAWWNAANASLFEAIAVMGLALSTGGRVASRHLIEEIIKAATMGTTVGLYFRST